jgi:hypothetical protein
MRDGALRMAISPRLAICVVVRGGLRDALKLRN